MYNRYCEIRDSKGVKDATVAKETGIPKSTFTDWKNGRSEPKKKRTPPKLRRKGDAPNAQP